MKFVEQYRWPIVIAIIIAVIGGIMLINSSASTPSEQAKQAEAAKEEERKSEEAKAKQEEAQKAKAKEYTYTARIGDAYSILARKAIQTYAKDAQIALNQAQIIAAETQLTIAAGSPLLDVQQKVTFTKAAVQAAVEAAQKLSAEQQAAWAVYAQYANFDTSQNG